MTPVTLEFLAQELALMRSELRCIIETLGRLDETQTRLEGRLVGVRDEVQDGREAMINVRRELTAHHRLQDQIGKRLQDLEQAPHAVALKPGRGPDRAAAAAHAAAETQIAQPRATTGV